MIDYLFFNSVDQLFYCCTSFIGIKQLSLKQTLGSLDLPLNQGYLCNPLTTATEAETRKIEKYRELIDNGYIFQPVALEVQGSLGESSEFFITRICKMLCRSHDDQRANSFLKQRISIALQIGNAACVLGTVSDRDAFEEI